MMELAIYIESAFVNGLLSELCNVNTHFHPTESKSVCVFNDHLHFLLREIIYVFKNNIMLQFILIRLTVFQIQRYNFETLLLKISVMDRFDKLSIVFFSFTICIHDD